MESEFSLNMKKKSKNLAPPWLPGQCVVEALEFYLLDHQASRAGAFLSPCTPGHDPGLALWIWGKGDKSRS